MNLSTGRHDSGSDSGTDLCHDDDSSSAASGEVSKNIPGLLFDTLKRVFTIVLLSDTSNHEVITIFACLLERCRAKESFNVSQKKCFSSWLQKLRALWNPPAIRKANDYKRRLITSLTGSSSSLYCARSFFLLYLSLVCLKRKNLFPLLGLEPNQGANQICLCGSALGRPRNSLIG